MLSMILTYLAIDAVVSLVTLGVAIYVFRKRGSMIRSMLRSWLGVKDPVIYYPEVSATDFNEEGLYVGNRNADMSLDDMEDAEDEDSDEDWDTDQDYGIYEIDKQTGYLKRKTNLKD